MNSQVLGIHHITAIAGQAQRNYDFYTKVLGQRLVKKTVNFDDPGTYHFYYGNENGSPGTILTFFPWTHVRRGMVGTGMATEIGYSVPAGSLKFWTDTFENNNVLHGNPFERFGEINLPFSDPDGLKLNLIIPIEDDKRVPWTTDKIQADVATRGFHNVVLNLKDVTGTAKVLTEIFGYKLYK